MHFAFLSLSILKHFSKNIIFNELHLDISSLSANTKYLSWKELLHLSYLMMYANRILIFLFIAKSGIFFIEIMLTN